MKSTGSCYPVFSYNARQSRSPRRSGPVLIMVCQLVNTANYVDACDFCHVDRAQGKPNTCPIYRGDWPRASLIGSLRQIVDVCCLWSESRPLIKLGMYLISKPCGFWDGGLSSSFHVIIIIKKIPIRLRSCMLTDILRIFRGARVTCFLIWKGCV